jgi:hypothetical protein
MRGGPSTRGRGTRLERPSNEATSGYYSHPAPYGGWNAKGNLADMDPREAIQMDNIFPGVQTVGIRKGCTEWVDGTNNLIFGGDGTVTTGWVSAGGLNDATPSIVAGKLRSTTGGGAGPNGILLQTFVTVPGRSYRIRATGTAGTANPWFTVSSAFALNDLYNSGSGSANLTVDVTVVATTALTYLHIVTGGPGTYSDWDDIIVEEVGAIYHSFLPYSGLTTDKLFAATDSAIFDVTNNGAPTLGVSCSDGYWESINFATAGGNFLFGVNGVDLAKTFNGSVWAEPAITVATSSDWSYVTSHKKRIWAVEKETMDLWYLPVDSIAGAATLFPVGSLFKKGGYVVAIGTWTVDGGAGVDDIFVIVTSNGEIAAYQGTDPASSATWALIGVYNVADPIGTKCLLPYGGDLLYLNANGILPLSKLLQSTTVDRSSGISYKIDGAFLAATEDYGTNIGWQMLTHKSANLLIVNVPVATDGVAYQFVMNTITKSWCRFTGWNANAWADFDGNIYFSDGLIIYKAWSGVDDAGVPIVCTILQAYSPLGARYQKNVTLVKPNFGSVGSANISLALDSDFQTFDGESIFTYAPTSEGAIWGVDLWDTAIWDSDASVFQNAWTTVPGNLGYLHSFRLQITTSSGNFIWTSTDFAYRGAGIL